MTQDPAGTEIRSADTHGAAPSLRTRLIVTNAVITILAVTALGYYVYYRTQRASASLADQLEANVRQQAQNELTANGDAQVATLNNFFTTVRRDITDSAASASALLSEEPGLSSGAYWNAPDSLTRISKGSWDNAVTGPASVFIPAQTELTDSLVQELNTLKQLDFAIPQKLKANPDAVAIYFGGKSGETLYYPDIDLANVVPADFDVTQRPWYVKADPAENPAKHTVWSDPYLDAALHGLVVTSSAPVFDSAGAFRGVIAMDIQLGRISDLVSNIHAGKTGYAFLIDRDKRLIAISPSGYADLGITADQVPLGDSLDPSKLPTALQSDFTALLSNMTAGQGGLQTISIRGTERFVLYRPVPDVDYSMGIMVPSSELLAGAIGARQQLAQASASTARVSQALVTLILGLAILATVLVSSGLVAPLVALTSTARQIIGGDLSARADVRSRDEIGVLSRTLNTMTDNLQQLVQSLETRVRDRTAALERASRDAARHAVQFEAITRVTAAISSIRNLQELLPLVSSVISEQFGYYHVGIFINDEDGGATRLIAANSPGGQTMLERRHSLKIGEQGLVGFVASRGEPRVAHRVGEDAVFFNNPDLPLTKSEAALPLRSGENVIGVLDVQSLEEDAFSPDDLRILGVLADHVSLAFENARLFEATRRSLTEAETLYRQYVREAWRGTPREQQVLGYRSTPAGSSPLGEADLQADHSPTTDGGETSPAAVLSIPIQLRGETIGELQIRGSEASPWTPEQIDLAHAVAERVALSAENARLFEETGRRAERERLVTEITSKIRRSNDPREMMQTALDELRSALGATKVQLIPQTVGNADASPELGEGGPKVRAPAGKWGVSMTYVIAISNEKGGVAKTTTTLSLGAVLAEAGHRVLLMDLDPQANLTLALGVEPGFATITSSHILIESAPLADAILKTDIENLALIPSHASIEAAEQFLPVRSHYTLGIRRALEAAPLDFDFVLMDCPPFLGAITTNALSAADLAIIPTQPEYFSAYALRNMMGMIRRVRQESNAALGYRILITLFDRRNRTHRSIQEQLRVAFGEGLFKTIIEVDTKLRESPIAGVPITRYRPGTRGSQQYRELAQELTEYVEQQAQQAA